MIVLQFWCPDYMTLQLDSVTSCPNTELAELMQNRPVFSKGPPNDIDVFICTNTSLSCWALALPLASEN